MSDTLDSIFGAVKDLGGEYIRTRYARPADPSAGGHAVPIPAETTVPVRPSSSGALVQYAPMILAAAAVVVIVGLALKKAG